MIRQYIMSLILDMLMLLVNSKGYVSLIKNSELLPNEENNFFNLKLYSTKHIYVKLSIKRINKYNLRKLFSFRFVMFLNL